MKPDAFSRQIIEKWMGYEFPEEITWNDVHEVIEEMERHGMLVSIGRSTCQIYIGYPMPFKEIASCLTDPETSKLQAAWAAITCGIQVYDMKYARKKMPAAVPSMSYAEMKSLS